MLNVADTAAMARRRSAAALRTRSSKAGSTWSGKLGRPAQAKVNWRQRKPWSATASKTSSTVGRANVLAKRPRIISDRVGELLHRLFLAVDALGQLKLGAAAIEVVVGAMDAEIGVATQIVGEEADADGEGDEFAGKGDEV